MSSYVMLITENSGFQEVRMHIMTDTTILAAFIKASLNEIGKQAQGLGTGLLNAAPGDKAANPNNSILYLLAISESLTKLAKDCEEQL